MAPSDPSKATRTRRYGSADACFTIRTGRSQKRITHSAVVPMKRSAYRCFPGPPITTKSTRRITASLIMALNGSSVTTIALKVRIGGHTGQPVG